MQKIQFDGVVIHGNKRGKALGFPTANQKLNTLIEEGIYISQSVFENNTYQSLTFIGSAKTFDDKQYQAETYLLNFDEDMYDKNLQVTLLKKIRGNEKFESVEQLIAQMNKDKQEAIEFFKDHE